MDQELFLDNEFLNFDNFPGNVGDEAPELPLLGDKEPAQFRPQYTHGSGQHINPSAVAGPPRSQAAQPSQPHLGPQNAFPGDYTSYVPGLHAGQHNSRAYNVQQHPLGVYGGPKNGPGTYHGQPHPPGTYNAQGGPRAYNAQPNTAGHSSQPNPPGAYSNQRSVPGSYVGPPNRPRSYTGQGNNPAEPQNRPHNTAATGQQYSVSGPTSFGPAMNRNPRSPTSWKTAPGRGFKAKPLGPEVQEVQNELVTMRARLEDLEKQIRELHNSISQMQQGRWIDRAEFDRMLAEQLRRFEEQQAMLEEVHNNVVILSGTEVPEAP